MVMGLSALAVGTPLLAAQRPRAGRRAPWRCLKGSAGAAAGRARAVGESREEVSEVVSVLSSRVIMLSLVMCMSAASVM